MWSIEFLTPLFLLLLLPVVALTLWPYFRVPKKYRRTRNRVIPVILHMLALTLAVFVLSGLRINYSEPYLRNEVMLLVDCSSSSLAVEDERDDFVKRVIAGAEDNYKLGIITFAYGQPVYAAELSYNTSSHFSKYLFSSVVDSSATDIASALRFAKERFSDPAYGKIVLVSDGLETDGSAMDVVMSIAAEGVKIDTVHISGRSSKQEMQINDILLPEERVVSGDTITVEAVVNSNYSDNVTFKLFDNDNMVAEVTQRILEGEQSVFFSYKIGSDAESSTPTLHKLTCFFESGADASDKNNEYNTYLYLDVFNRVLILEHDDGNESYVLNNILKGSYESTVMKISSAPNTVEKLREYDQVVMVNIANADMPEGFDSLLRTYVQTHGGGLFTVGGNKMEDGKSVQNMYDPNDLYIDNGTRESIYQQMLPVLSEDYTPPLGLMIVLDRSGSMKNIAEGVAGNQTLMDLAKKGAADCVNALTYRDYVGIVSFDMLPVTNIPPTSITQKQLILNAITGIKAAGDTAYTGAIEMASRHLLELPVEKKHIIFVTDGVPVESQETFLNMIRHYNEAAGITLSTLFISNDPAGAAICQNMAEAGKGRCHIITKAGQIPGTMSEEVKVPEISKYVATTFTPLIRDVTSVVRGIDQSDIPELDGYYGTRARNDVDIPLWADFVPVYAQWSYGKGKVGSFMCDLNGTWSNKFLSDPVGQLIITNIIKALFPSVSLRPKDIETSLVEDNYTTNLSIITAAENGEYIEISAYNVSDGSSPFATLRPAISKNYARCSFVITTPGVYRLEIVKKTQAGEIITESTQNIYRSFSYSSEYDEFVDIDSGIQLLTELAANSRGSLIDSVEEVFGELESTRPRTFDPVYIFIITALVCILLDIAVRKFKFKWPHELIRDYKIKKSLPSNSLRTRNQPQTTQK